MLRRHFLRNMSGTLASLYAASRMRNIQAQSTSDSLVANSSEASSHTETTAIAADPAMRLELNVPISTWDEAIPIGDCDMGGLLWGEGNTVKLSLDCGGLWDNRTPEIFKQADWNYATIQKLVAEGNQTEISRLFDVPYDTLPYPTKLPGARLEITFPDDEMDGGEIPSTDEKNASESEKDAHSKGDGKRLRTWKLNKFTLDLRNAIGQAVFANGETLTGFFTKDLAIFHTSHLHPELKLVAPTSIAQLGYPPAETGEAVLLDDQDADGRYSWIQIKQPDECGGLWYTVVALSRLVRGERWMAVSFTVSSKEMRSCESKDDNPDARFVEELSHDPLAAGLWIARGAFEYRVNADDFGPEVHRRQHDEKWTQFWEKSNVSLPDPAIQKHYQLARYFYGASSSGGFPIPLQGLWTADAGTLPPWKGDYHHDLNTQYTYSAYYTPGHFAQGFTFLRFMFDLSERHRQFAKDFYGVSEGLIVPGVMGVDGQPLAGWSQYSLSPTMSGWVSQHFYLHWKYTHDSHFLRTFAYPYCREIGIALSQILREEKDDHGQAVLRLPLSSSCELHDNSIHAWITPNSNQDVAILTHLYHSLVEMAGTMKNEEDTQRWTQILEKLEPLAVDENSVLKISRDEAFMESHRHHAHLMAIHPFGTLNMDGGETNRKTILASLDALRAKGTSAWCGYSFAWASCLESRAGRGNEAYEYLSTFVRAFILRNGFHANGDQTKSGLSNFTYRPFTLEGNFAAMQAVHEMLLQSWGGKIRLFPAIPDHWRAEDQTISFVNWRTECGVVVSATMRDGKLTYLKIARGLDGDGILFSGLSLSVVLPVDELPSQQTGLRATLVERELTLRFEGSEGNEILIFGSNA